MKYLMRKISGSVMIVMLLCGSFIIPYISIPEYVSAADDQEYVAVDNDEDALAGVIAYLNYRGLGFLSEDINAVRAFLSDSQVELSEFYDLIRKTPAGILRFTYNAQALYQLNILAQRYIDKYGLLNYSENNDSSTNDVYSGYMITDPNGVQVICYTVNKRCSSESWIEKINSNVSVEIGGKYKYPLSYFTSANGTLTCGFPVYSTSLVNQYHDNGLFGFESVGYRMYGYHLGDKSYNRSYIFKKNGGEENSTNTDLTNNQGFTVIRSSDGHFFVGSIAKVSGGGMDGQWLICATQIKQEQPTDPVSIHIYTPKGVKPAPDPDEPVTPKNRDGSHYQYNYSNTYIDNSIENNTTYYGGDDDGGGGNEEDPPQNSCDHTGIESRLDQIKQKIDRIISLISTPSDWSIPDPSDINLHDTNFGLPVQLEHYFPFCIPWDMILLFEALDAEPQPPRFQGPIHFGLGGTNLYTWNVDLDFTPYSDIAERVRMVEFVAFLLFLMLLTAKLFRG